MMDATTVIDVDGANTLIISLLVLYVGKFLTNRVRLLHEHNIPSAVIGGLFCSVLVAALYVLANVRLKFAVDLRDLLLLVFFSTVGLSANLTLLRDSGKAVFVLLVLATAVLIFQDMVGSAVAASFSVHPAYGLLAGSISFVGGHGTSIAWGDIFEDRFALADAQDAAVACATFGLILAGLIGGPLARHLLVKNHIKDNRGAVAFTPADEAATKRGPITMDSMLGALLLIALCVAGSAILGKWLVGVGVTLPNFVVALMLAAILTNLADIVGAKINANAVSLISDASLQVFLAMSIMTIQLWTLAAAFSPLLAVLVLQAMLMLAFVYWIVFPVMGRDYHASVVCAGFVGFGLGATAVGLANMRAITHQHGASPTSFLVVPIVGGFLIDLVNAGIITLYLASRVLG